VEIDAEPSGHESDGGEVLFGGDIACRDEPAQLVGQLCGNGDVFTRFNGKQVDPAQGVRRFPPFSFRIEQLFY
jgi:hypothetical protein